MKTTSAATAATVQGSVNLSLTTKEAEHIRETFCSVIAMLLIGDDLPANDNDTTQVLKAWEAATESRKHMDEQGRIDCTVAASILTKLQAAKAEVESR